MATLAEIARRYTDVDEADLGHLQRLIGQWAPLADMSFADLMLLLPVTNPATLGSAEPGSSFVVVGQIRPTTNQTVYRHDFVGAIIRASDRPPVADAMAGGGIVEAEVELPAPYERILEMAVPVRVGDRVVAVCTCDASIDTGRRAGELETVYTEVFERFARMIAAGSFPFAAEEGETEEAPRVGDGVLVLDDHGRVDYASPNAVTALTRAGVTTNVEGLRLADFGIDESAVATAYAFGQPMTEELEWGPQVSIILRCMPMLDRGRVTGSLVLLRDVSELRHRDRLLVSMDASLREIHHRVKNNLQTISSLLRLQGRRATSPEAKDAIDEAVRRIRTISLVHEILSGDASDEVEFGEIVRPVVRMVEEELIDPDRRVTVTITGDAGSVPPEVATPLAVVLNELLQNTVDHAFPRLVEGHSSGPLADGHVVIDLADDGRELTMRVSDDGVGLPVAFDLDQSPGLGLSIVRSLVTSQLDGTIHLQRGDGSGSGDGVGPGTVVEVRVPIAPHDKA